MAALRLVEKGKLNLDEDVNKKLVSWKIPENEFTKEQKVTLRGLLTHNAGLSVSGFPGYPTKTNPLPTVLQILDGSLPANTKPVRVIRTPGTQWSYSGGGITVMQQLLTDISEKPFPALMKEAVLNKLKMKNSTYEQPLPSALHNKAAKAHDNKGEKVVSDWHVYPEMAAAGLWTTPSDIGRFAVELQKARAGKSKKVLSPEMTRQMLTKQSGGWGLGITVTGEGKASRFSHGGSNKGYRCTMIAYNETGQGAVVMTNSENGDGLIEEVTRSIAKEYGWADYLTPEKTFVELDPQMYGQYTGKYEDDISVIVEDGKLKIHYGGEEKNELFAESETKFFVREKPLEVAFVKDTSGRVTKMIFRFRGRDIPLNKL
jgi:CubicO group peptidase (beta-lactamase class C family)